MNKLAFSEMFNTSNLESSAEVVLAYFLGRELGRRGMVLDMSDITLDESNLTDSQRLILHHQVKCGNILYTREITGYLSETDLIDNMEHLETSDYVQESEDGLSLQWDQTYAQSTYKNFYKINNKFNKTFIPHSVVAKHIIDCVLGEESRKLTMVFVQPHSDMVGQYDWLEYLLKVYPKLQDILAVSTDLRSTKYDYSKHIFSSETTARNRVYSIKSKLEQAGKLGIVEGAICVLWTRSMNETDPEKDSEAKRKSGEKNSRGLITQRVLVRIDDISIRGIRYTTIPEPYTREERYTEYSKINEDRRIEYSDIIGMKLSFTRSSNDLTNLAFGNYMGMEEHILEPIDVSNDATVKVTTADSEGEPSVRNITMSTQDAIYWILRQYEVEFDRELYKKMYYKDGNKPLFDEVSWEVYSDNGLTLETFAQSENS